MAAETLQKVSISEISKNNDKRIQLLDYLKNFLSEKEKEQLTNPKDIISIAVSKYSKQRQNKSKIEVVDIYEGRVLNALFNSYQLCYNTSKNFRKEVEEKWFMFQLNAQFVKVRM
jgi:hypothetical protein